MNRRLASGDGLSSADEAEFHNRLAHLEEEKMRRHELEELEALLKSVNLTPEQEMAAREKIHQVEGFARAHSRKQVLENIESGALSEGQAEQDLLSLDDADATAKNQAKLLARHKSGVRKLSILHYKRAILYQNHTKTRKFVSKMMNFADIVGGGARCVEAPAGGVGPRQEHGRCTSGRVVRWRFLGRHGRRHH